MYCWTRSPATNGNKYQSGTSLYCFIIFGENIYGIHDRSIWIDWASVNRHGDELVVTIMQY